MSRKRKKRQGHRRNGVVYVGRVGNRMTEVHRTEEGRK